MPEPWTVSYAPRPLPSAHLAPGQPMVAPRVPQTLSGRTLSEQVAPSGRTWPVLLSVGAAIALTLAWMAWQ